MRIRYRLSQVWHNLTAGPLPDSAWQEVAGVLTPNEQALFRRYDNADQWHTWRVFRTLRAEGIDDRHLLAAALLHDVGKTACDSSMWERSLAVAVERVWPGRVAAWGSGDSNGWRRPFAIRHQHAARGAEMAAAAGSPPEVVALIANHQTPDLDSLTAREIDWLNALQRADDQH